VGFARLWKPSIIAIAVVLSIPVLAILSSILQPSGDAWTHIRNTVLPEYLSNTATLVFGVAIGTLLLGVSTAWLTAMCRFPGKRAFVWLLLLPLAMPAYIIAYTYTGMLDFAGPVQSQIREWTGWQHGEYYFPHIRSLGGAVVMLSLVLFPYVYLLARAAFLEQSICVLEVSRTLGCNAWSSFMRVAVPLARPAIVAGLSLALMETLADYGTVAYFGLGVFTTGIFRTWFGLGDATAAAKMASLLLVFVFALILLERASRRKAQFHHTTNRYSRLPEYSLEGWRAAGAVVACSLPVVFGFVLPAAQLGIWTVETFDTMVDERFIELSLNSLLLALGAGLLSVFVAIFLAYGKRTLPNRSVSASIRVASMGYATPGTIIAIGIIVPFAWVDGAINELTESLFGITVGLVLSGTLFGLLFAYVVRFLAVSLQTLESGLTKIRSTMDDAARSLGYRPGQTLWAVHVPLMKGSVLTALLLVFVDVMKELPATLILRPFDFNTLAVRAFELASDERLADSSSAALMIVAIGLLPVVLLSRTIEHSRAGTVSR
jgi:iron(III) transport system permease protein